MANDYYIPDEGTAWQQKQQEEEEMWQELEQWLMEKQKFDEQGNQNELLRTAKN